MRTCYDVLSSSFCETSIRTYYDIPFSLHTLAYMPTVRGSTFFTLLNNMHISPDQHHTLATHYCTSIDSHT